MPSRTLSYVLSACWTLAVPVASYAEASEPAGGAHVASGALSGEVTRPAGETGFIAIDPAGWEPVSAEVWGRRVTLAPAAKGTWVLPVSVESKQCSWRVTLKKMSGVWYNNRDCLGHTQHRRPTMSDWTRREFLSAAGVAGFASSAALKAAPPMPTARSARKRRQARNILL